MDGKNKGKINRITSNIQLKVDIIIFNEGETVIVYCPPLDLSGYGNNLTEAKQSFKACINEYFRYTTKKGTLLEDLKQLGWTIRKKYEPIQPPSLQKLLHENKNFSRIFNTYDFRKTNTQVNIPAIA